MTYKIFTLSACIGISLLSFLLDDGDHTLLPESSMNENHPPVVKILTPAADSRFQRNTLVSYSIEVADKEDGESKYGEIVSEEVFLEIKSFEDEKLAVAYLGKEGQKDPDGLAAIKRSDCFLCHSMNAKLIGPSLKEISKRYGKMPSINDKLLLHIKKGVSGIWGEQVMPAHPQLSDEQIRSMVHWILQNGNDPAVDYQRGLQGTFWFRPPSKSGIYVLSASYTDHGPGGSLTGWDRVMIKESGE